MRKIIKYPLYIVAVIVFGLISGHLTFTLLSHSKTVIVPDLKGKSMIEAGNLLRKNDLYIRLEGEDFDPVVAQGSIMWQQIPGGSTVKEGREIGVMISKGPRIRYVPDVVGQPLESADQMLREKGIKITRAIYVSHPTVMPNIVIAQRPEIHEKGGDTFFVLVSTGISE
ncbi:MAG TPA: PASTA domain-containing protein [Nitrospirae bacterium]|nr:PASTA domain-containing protein [Nitrospirota bacterium]